MDEFTAIGKVGILASAIGFMAGYNLRLLPVVQSMAQLDATYGKDVARTLMTNHAVQILFAPREQQDANDYSDMLGYTTVRRQNVTRGREVSRSESLERRALMAQYGVETSADARGALQGAGIAISLVTADPALDAARDIDPLLASQSLWCDLNSVSPASKRTITPSASPI
jgi:type IV secretion system protein VirD4